MLIPPSLPKPKEPSCIISLPLFATRSLSFLLSLPILTCNESLRFAQEGLRWLVLAQISQTLDSGFRFLLLAELMERHRSERQSSAVYAAVARYR